MDVCSRVPLTQQVVDTERELFLCSALLVPTDRLRRMYNRFEHLGHMFRGCAHGVYFEYSFRNERVHWRKRIHSILLDSIARHAQKLL